LCKAIKIHVQCRQGEHKPDPEIFPNYPAIMFPGEVEIKKNHSDGILLRGKKL
jgi:hypothetical protein